LFILVSYDITNDRRRGKLSKLLEDFGGKRVQRSVFECYLTAKNYEKLLTRLNKLMDPETDSVRFYTLCESCQGKIKYLGVAEPVEMPGLMII